MEVLPAYWGIETFSTAFATSFSPKNLEVLPAYWGIETHCWLTSLASTLAFVIWKYYPPTGVLKLFRTPLLFSKPIIYHLEVLPAYWGIETPPGRPRRSAIPLEYLEVLPAYWGIETVCFVALWDDFETHLEVLPAYWGIETFKQNSRSKFSRAYLEVLPAYWGIETFCSALRFAHCGTLIWKYYPPTGVLKLKWIVNFDFFGALKNLEVLPAYWGIETIASTANALFSSLNLEVLPAYWGIETIRMGIN